jgi:N-methylhydantoinase B/acetone carboxylase alpha subunit
MATTDVTRELEPRPAPIGWDGRTLAAMLAESEQRFEQTGHYQGLERMPLKEADPLHFEKLFSRVRGGMVSARETAMNISASPIVRELGEITFALYTPEGDSISLSTGIIVHVHTMSDAIKYMVRNGWEDNPGIRPGDIFANNVPSIGDVHPADVQTFVPIFNPESDPAAPELIAWAGGVIHVMDIGASAPGGVPVGPTTRFDDGLCFHCTKIGERDEIARWHLAHVKDRSRAPGLYLLDERTRLAGCHMIRDAVERLVLEEGAERFKQFSREAIEDGRRGFKSTVRAMTVPGRYRSPGFMDLQFADKQSLPARARRDQLVHGNYEVRIDGDGHWTTDLTGSSAWGWHSMNATPSGHQGMQWILFTQTLICNDKINDGAYYGTSLELDTGSWCDLGDAPGSSSVPWSTLFATYTGYPRSLSRALQSRGYIEEIIGAFNTPGNAMQGGGIDQYGQFSGFMNFEFGASGIGAKYVTDGLDYGAAVFNPEGDMGDAEMWELVVPKLYLSRRVAPSSGGAGRHRGGTSFFSLVMIWNTPDFEMENITGGTILTSPGLFGGYPAPTGYVHNVHGTDLVARAQAGEAYPFAELDRENPALLELGGEHDLRQEGFTMLMPFESGDLYLSANKGAAGMGDPLLRPVEAVERDVAENHLLPRFAESLYAVSDRDGARRRRLERAVPYAQWWAAQRERVLAQDLIEPVKVMFAESMRLTPAFAAEYRGFWDLPEDFDFDVVCPTLPIQRAESGKVTPAESVAAYLDGATAHVPAGEEPIHIPSDVTEDTLRDLLDERLVRRAVKEIQSSIKDADRFDKWLRVLQERVDYDDPIVLPYGEGMNIVRRRSDGELVIRTDAGADLSRWDENWKTGAVMFVRDTPEAFQEVYPKLGHPDGAWQELREYYCPISGRLLETEALPPGYPAVHEYLPDLEGLYEGWLGRELP